MKVYFSHPLSWEGGAKAILYLCRSLQRQNVCALASSASPRSKKEPFGIPRSLQPLRCWTWHRALFMQGAWTELVLCFPPTILIGRSDVQGASTEIMLLLLSAMSCTLCGFAVRRAGGWWKGAGTVSYSSVGALEAIATSAVENRRNRSGFSTLALTKIKIVPVGSRSLPLLVSSFEKLEVCFQFCSEALIQSTFQQQPAALAESQVCSGASQAALAESRRGWDWRGCLLPLLEWVVLFNADTRSQLQDFIKYLMFECLFAVSFCTFSALGSCHLACADHEEGKGMGW